MFNTARMQGSEKVSEKVTSEWVWKEGGKRAFHVSGERQEQRYRTVEEEIENGFGV